MIIELTTGSSTAAGSSPIQKGILRSARPAPLPPSHVGGAVNVHGPRRGFTWPGALALVKDVARSVRGPAGASADTRKLLHTPKIQGSPVVQVHGNRPRNEQIETPGGRRPAAAFLGKCRSTSYYVLPGGELVAMQHGRTLREVEQQFANGKYLEGLGIPVVPVLGVWSAGNQHGLVMERIGGGVSSSQGNIAKFMTDRTESDLVKIGVALINAGIDVDSLKLIIAEGDGRAFVRAPLRLEAADDRYPTKALTELEQLRHLHALQSIRTGRRASALTQSEDGVGAAARAPRERQQ